MPKILFVGENNACRSRMAQAFTVAMAPFPLEAISAGYRNGVVHPMVSQVLAEVGVAVTDGPGFSLGELGGQSFDLVGVLSPRTLRAKDRPAKVDRRADARLDNGSYRSKIKS